MFKEKMQTSVLVFAVVLLFLITAGEGAKILALFPVFSKSHMNVNAALAKQLARRGHEVTVYSPFHEKQAIPNYTHHIIDYKIESTNNTANSQTVFHMKDMNVIQFTAMLSFIGELITKTTLENDSIQKLLNSANHYDAIILDAALTEGLMGFAHKFKAPLIQISALGGTHWMGDAFGNPNPYAYVPDAFLSFSDKMTFWERLQNTLVGTAIRLGRHFYHLPKQNALMKKYFNQTKDLPSVYELEMSTDLLLLNSHFSISYPKPLMPNMIQVGGMHIKPPQKLPKDLQEFLDNAKDGVIYFSMGSAVRSADFPEEHKKILLQVFSKLKQKVLWKWEDDTLPDQPSNLKVGKWLPQSDILAHPNVRAFITHGGLLSSQEAIARGIPIVGIPLYGDQVLNMKMAVGAGYGILLDFHNITVPSLSWALNEVLNNPSYLKNAKRMSKLYLDQPMSPLDTAVYWTEYVIRHNGTSHMRSAALDLYWFQYFLLDVILFLTLGVLGLLLTSFLVLRALLQLCTKRSAVVASRKKKMK